MWWRVCVIHGPSRQLQCVRIRVLVDEEPLEPLIDLAPVRHVRLLMPAHVTRYQRQCRKLGVQ
jgi:hypothetical protein